uniref:BTB_2 domain-containing protein n=1 Tax=Steinernema glaseri TaxID=37863 RepID=A0A1I7Y6R4_9BILA
MASPVVRLNVSGEPCLVMRHVLQREPHSLLAKFSERADDKEPIFVDRNAELFCLLLNALRHPKMVPVLPDNFDKWTQLLLEAQFLRLPRIEQWIVENTPRSSVITVSYHGTLSFGRQGITSDVVNFRKIHRILVCGRVPLCRQVFGESLNETRDSGMGEEDRYTARFYLKHSFLEQAFDVLAQNGFQCVSSSANSPANSSDPYQSEEERYMHYSQFIFIRNN